MTEHNLFLEKQYLGYNKYSFLRRGVLALFCFVAYYWSEKYDSAIIDLSVAIVYDPKLQRTLYTRAMCYYYSKQLDYARNCLQSYLHYEGNLGGVAASR